MKHPRLKWYKPHDDCLANPKTIGAACGCLERQPCIVAMGRFTNANPPTLEARFDVESVMREGAGAYIVTLADEVNTQHCMIQATVQQSRVPRPTSYNIVQGVVQTAYNQDPPMVAIVAFPSGATIRHFAISVRDAAGMLTDAGETAFIVAAIPYWDGGRV